jgi:hypothetical protein
MTYEYTEELFCYTDDGSTKWLNQKALDGFRLAMVINNRKNQACLYVMEREVPESAPPTEALPTNDCTCTMQTATQLVNPVCPVHGSGQATPPYNRAVPLKDIIHLYLLDHGWEVDDGKAYPYYRLDRMGAWVSMYRAVEYQLHKEEPSE